MRDGESVITLMTELANDLSALERIAERLKPPPAKLRVLPTSDPVVAAVAFELHNYYCVSENLTRRIATASSVWTHIPYGSRR